jgi:hypothetical protein
MRQVVSFVGIYTIRESGIERSKKFP